MRPRTLAWIVATYVVVLVVTRVLGLEPDPLLLALSVALAAGFLGLTLVGLRNESAFWDVDATTMSAQSGHDARFAATVRVVDGHLHAREPDGILRDRLSLLADRTLTLRHGIGLDDPRAADLLGPAVMAVLRGPVRRLGVPEIDATLTRIEEL
jgi:hypothetical protein